MKGESRLVYSTIVDDRWEDDFAIGDAEVYYAGEWEYNSEGIPTPLIDR